MPYHLLLLLFLSLATIHSPLLYGQSTNAAITGQVTDPTKAVIPDAKITAINTGTNLRYEGATDKSGSYVITSIPPGNYRIEVEKLGFKTIIKPDITLHVQDTLEINFEMALGSASEAITVRGGAPLADTQDATVSTVVDRNFAENLPMNGRSFQTLIQLTPGVVLSATSAADNGQFSVNGQRAISNYWMVDGVSANIGVTGFVGGGGFSGVVGSFSAQGGTNSLVSVDAMEEFRIQTSTYAPEFGRTPGGQISIVTRSGTNQFHGTAFDYVRNDIFDANNWFNAAVTPPLSKAKERQNDFGGTFSGPIIKDRTFFFFSYEGLRLRLPQTMLTTVPDANFTPGGTTNSRQNAAPALQPFLNAFPLPNGKSSEIFVPCDPATDLTCPSSGQKATGSAAFNASFSDSSTLDAYSLRIDHKLHDKLTVFGRYNYSPSEILARGGNGASLSTLSPSRITTQTATIGGAWVVSPQATNDLRFNYSRNVGNSSMHLDGFGGAVPLASVPIPSPFTNQNAAFVLDIFSLSDGLILVGKNGRNIQRQINVVDSLSIQKGSHRLKFGVDLRRLTPIFDPALYGQFDAFNDVPSFEVGALSFSFLESARNATLLFHNLGVYVEDAWRVIPRLTLTYGLRWDVDFAPSSINGPSLPAVTSFKLNDLSNLALASAGTPPFKTTYGNVAPRLGVAYQLFQTQDRQTILRGGFGVFYDLATSEVGNLLASAAYPFGAFTSNPGGTFPLDPATAAPPPITAPGGGLGEVTAFDPHLQLPYTLQWNVALEQGLGKQQILSASYIGSAGRRLLQTAEVFSPNPTFGLARLVGNSATSDYNALQLQLRRRLSHGLQALASYTWSRSIDDASAGSYGNGSNTLVPTINPTANRGPSDFDIRNSFSAVVTYDIPAPKVNAFTSAILRGWSLQNVIQGRSAPPVDVFNSTFFTLFNGFTNIRPDVVPGVSFYLHGPQYPGGKAFNPAAFTNPPIDPNTGAPLRQGNLSRNALRGFGATQWDFAVHRDFPIHESLKLQFRTEMFNVLNHPNFAPPTADINNPQFGLSTQMLGQFLSGGIAGFGGFSPLYQIGGPRSIQFALKLSF